VDDKCKPLARGGEATVELPAAAAPAFPALFAELEACRSGGAGSSDDVVVGGGEGVTGEGGERDGSSGGGGGESGGGGGGGSGGSGGGAPSLRLRGYGVSMTTLEVGPCMLTLSNQR
jgi:hypothetical protein